METEVTRPSTASPRRLIRSRDNRMIAGVCGGIAEYFDLDPTIIRLGWIVAAFVSGGLAIPAYAVCWLVIPLADRADFPRTF